AVVGALREKAVESCDVHPTGCIGRHADRSSVAHAEQARGLRYREVALRRGEETQSLQGDAALLGLAAREEKGVEIGLAAAAGEDAVARRVGVAGASGGPIDEVTLHE